MSESLCPNDPVPSSEGSADELLFRSMTVHSNEVALEDAELFEVASRLKPSKARASLGEFRKKFVGSFTSSGVFTKPRPSFVVRLRSFWYFGVLNFFNNLGELNRRKELDFTGLLVGVGGGCC